MRIAIGIALIALAAPALAQSQAEINDKCSADANARKLHGIERLKFREQCKSPGVPSKAARWVLRRPAGDPGFDCILAKIAAARLICADADLTTLELLLGKTFADIERAASAEDRRSWAKEELNWLRERNQKCGLAGKDNASIEEIKAAKSCLEDVICDRIVELEVRAQKRSNSPTASGADAAAANEGPARPPKAK